MEEPALRLGRQTGPVDELHPEGLTRLALRRAIRQYRGVHETPGELARLIDAATSFAWMPWANLGGRGAQLYHDRRAAHGRFVLALAELPASVLGAIPADLVRALERAARVSTCNHVGLRYHERKAATRELRGALDAHRGWLP